MLARDVEHEVHRLIRTLTWASVTSRGKLLRIILLPVLPLRPGITTGGLLRFEAAMTAALWAPAPTAAAFAPGRALRPPRRPRWLLRPAPVFLGRSEMIWSRAVGQSEGVKRKNENRGGVRNVRRRSMQCPAISVDIGAAMESRTMVTKKRRGAQQSFVGGTSHVSALVAIVRSLELAACACFTCCSDPASLTTAAARRVPVTCILTMRETLSLSSGTWPSSTLRSTMSGGGVGRAAREPAEEA